MLSTNSLTLRLKFAPFGRWDAAYGAPLSFTLDIT